MLASTLSAGETWALDTKLPRSRCVINGATHSKLGDMACEVSRGSDRWLHYGPIRNSAPVGSVPGKTHKTIIASAASNNPIIGHKPLSNRSRINWSVGRFVLTGRCLGDQLARLTMTVLL